MDKQKAQVLKTITKAAVALGVILFFGLSTQIFETNNAGHFQIKQAAITGKMTVRMQPGLYPQMFGDIFTYQQVATVGFGKEEEGEGYADLDAIPVIFNDGSRASITGLVRVKLPEDPDKALALKTEYSQGYNHFIKSGVLPIVRNAVKLSANLRSAQEAYTTLALFQQAIEDQLKNGPYLTKSDTVKVKKSTGDTEIMKVTKIVYGKDGKPKRLNNRFKELGCDVTEVVIGVPDFDKKVEDMIARRKDETMKTELAKQEAIRAKQDAITIAEKGKADVARAEAEALVLKKKEVVEAEKLKEVAQLEAEKKFEVAKYAAKEALENAKKIKANGMAKAAANRALVAAGLTPKERAEYRVKAITAAFNGWSKRPVPTTIMGMGGSTGKGGSALTELLSADAALNLMEKFNKPAK